MANSLPLIDTLARSIVDSNLASAKDREGIRKEPGRSAFLSLVAHEVKKLSDAQLGEVAACGKAYSDHPQDGSVTLHDMCPGWRVLPDQSGRDILRYVAELSLSARIYELLQVQP